MHDEALPTILVTGGAGLLGRTLLALAPAGATLHATQRQQLVVGAVAHTVELSDGAAVAALFEQVQPTLVIHTAFSYQGARDILAATRHVVEGCHATGAALIHLSTDALFDGEQAPYDESAEPAPLHDYGRWKTEAEWLVREALPQAAVVRTSLIVQFTPLDRNSAWVADSLREGKPITLFVDELRCPILAEDLAQQIWEVAALSPAERAGVWHLAGPEAVSRYALGLLIAAHEGLDPRGITPALSATYPTPRPRDLRLLTTRADRALRTRARPVSVLSLANGVGFSPSTG